MIRGLYTAVSGLITGEAKQSVVSNNMANANTVGFKGDNLSTKSFGDVMLQNYDKVVNGKNVRNELGKLSMGSEINEVSTGFTQGTIEDTGKNTDFAIDGRGFFSVRRDDGVATKNFYSRDGHFHVNSQGFLVNDSGDKVLGRNTRTNAVEPILVGSGSIQCDKSGNIKINNKDAYKFQLADFRDEKSLKKVGDNVYEGQNPIQNVNISVKQNSLERSNINIVNEMVNMMTTMRNFESNQKVVQAMDETLGKAVNEVGAVR